MAGGVIRAAWIQAAPVAVAAGVAIYGLGTWREQARDERRLRHAERAMVSGTEAIELVRAIRFRFSNLSREDAGDGVHRAEEYRRVVTRRIEKAGDAYMNFRKHYIAVRLFSPKDSALIDVASEMFGCINELAIHADGVFFLEKESQTSAAARSELVEERKSLLGSSDPLAPDPIEVRLRTADSAMKAELTPVLLSSRDPFARLVRWLLPRQ